MSRLIFVEKINNFLYKLVTGYNRCILGKVFPVFTKTLRKKYVQRFIRVFFGR